MKMKRHNNNNQPNKKTDRQTNKQTHTNKQTCMEALMAERLGKGPLNKHGEFKPMLGESSRRQGDNPMGSYIRML